MSLVLAEETLRGLRQEVLTSIGSHSSFKTSLIRFGFLWWTLQHLNGLK